MIKTTTKKEFSSSKPASTVIPKIYDVLNFMRNEWHEVPFIASYRKEFVVPELSVDDLWRIYEQDERYCQLKARKDNLLKLYERMQRFQAEQMSLLSARVQQVEARKAAMLERNSHSHGDPDDAEHFDTMLDAQQIEDDEQQLARQLDTLRPIVEADLERVRSAQRTDDFLDCYHHFQLHYGSDMINMKQYEHTVGRHKSRSAAATNNDGDDDNDADGSVPFCSSLFYSKKHKTNIVENDSMTNLSSRENSSYTSPLLRQNNVKKAIRRRMTTIYSVFVFMFFNFLRLLFYYVTFVATFIGLKMSLFFNKKLC